MAKDTKGYKIFSYLDNLKEIYSESTELVDGLFHNPREVLKTIEFYSNNKFMSGNKDELGREKPFYNVGNYRVTVAKIGTDVDLKDFKYEPDILTKQTSVAAMLINRELYKFLKEINFSKTLNDMGQTRPKYGGLLVKKYKYGKEIDVQVCQWKDIDFDPCDVMGGPIIESHHLTGSEVTSKKGVWNDTELTNFIEAHNKAHKDKPVRFEVKELTGEFPESIDPDVEVPDDMKYKTLCFYIGEVNKKKFYLYKEELKSIKDKYLYLPWEMVPGRGLGRGIIEEGFESQVWVNDAMISYKNVMDISGKVVLSTNSQKVSGNAIVGVDNGHIFQLEPNASITSLNLAPTALPQFVELINLWNSQYDKTSSTYDANTGEAPTAGTPYSQTALLNQVANSPFEYQREVWGIFLNELVNSWILPHIKSRLYKEHIFVGDFDDNELEIIDETINVKNHNAMMKEALLSGRAPKPQDVVDTNQEVSTTLKGFGKKREVEIPEKFLDIEGKITLNITGEMKNKSAILQSLDGILKTVVSTFNPQTGSYAALEDPTLSKIFNQIIELAGVPISSFQLSKKPVTQPDMSAVSQPAQPVANQV